MIGLLGLMPFFLAALTCLAITIALVHQLENDRKICRQNLAEGLEQGAPYIKKLLDLNPNAQGLRVQVIVTKAKLATAVVNANPVAVGFYSKRLQVLKKAQQTLHQQQTLLFQTGNRILGQAQLKTWRLFVIKKTPFYTRFAKEPTIKPFAVHPDDSSIAPTWSFDRNFSVAQKLQQAWSLKYQVNGPLSHFIKASGKMEDSCTITLNHQWRAQIAEDKFF